MVSKRPRCPTLQNWCMGPALITEMCHPCPGASVGHSHRRNTNTSRLPDHLRTDVTWRELRERSRRLCLCWMVTGNTEMVVKAGTGTSSCEKVQLPPPLLGGSTSTLGCLCRNRDADSMNQGGGGEKGTHGEAAIAERRNPQNREIL